MVVNTKAVQEVTDQDIGRPISYWCAGMIKPRHGWVRNRAMLPDHTFVRFKGRDRDELVDLYNCRWGHVDAWK